MPKGNNNKAHTNPPMSKLLEMLKAAGIEVHIVQMEPPQMFVVDRTDLEGMFVNAIRSACMAMEVPAPDAVEVFAHNAVEISIANGTLSEVEIEQRAPSSVRRN